MAVSNELDCTVFVEASLPPDALTALLAQALGATVSGKTIHTGVAEIEVRRNTDASHEKAREFPDGFLAFAFALEVYADSGASVEDRASLVGKLLEACWAAQLSAIVSCDYEERLPHNGGYKSGRIPWPKQAASVDGNNAQASAAGSLASDFGRAR